MSSYQDLVQARIAGRNAERDYAASCAHAADELRQALQTTLDHEPIEAHPRQPEKPDGTGSPSISSAMALGEEGWYDLRLVFILAEGPNVFPKQGVSLPASVKLAGGRVRYRLAAAETTLGWPLDQEGARQLGTFVGLVTSALREQLAESFRRMVDGSEKAPHVAFLWLIEKPE